MASILKVDELRGIASAGDITITSEGGAATQSLQQGLAKALAKLDVDAVIDESLNVSSAVDNSTGNFSITLTNNMSSSVHIALTGSGNTKHSQANEGARTTSVGSILNFNNSHVYQDGNDMNFAMHGDLA